MKYISFQEAVRILDAADEIMMEGSLVVSKSSRVECAPGINGVQLRYTVRRSKDNSERVFTEVNNRVVKVCAAKVHSSALVLQDEDSNAWALLPLHGSIIKARL